MPRSRWKDNIKMDLKEIGINTRNWLDSALDRNYWRALVNAALNLSSPNIIRVVQSRKLRWAGHEARMKKVRVLSKC